MKHYRIEYVRKFVIELDANNEKEADEKAMVACANSEGWTWDVDIEEIDL